MDVSALLPPDDAAAGFDNIADVLGVSPGLIEGYVAAAAKISRLAIGDPSIGLDRAVYRVPGDLDQDAHVDGLPLGTRGGVVITHTFPLDAEYDLQVGQAGGGRLGRRPTLGPRADELVRGHRRTRASPCRGAAPTRLRIAAGPHEIAAAAWCIESRTTGADGVFHVETRTPGVTQITIAGPLNPTGPGDTPSRASAAGLHAGVAADEIGRARDRFSPRWPSARTGGRSRHRHRKSRRCSRSIATGAPAAPSNRASSARWRACWSIRSSSSGSSASPRPSRRRRLSRQRPRAGVAAVVLPVEQYSGR